MTRTPRSRSRAALLAATTLAGVGAVHGGDYMTPGFLSKATRPLRVALLPPHAEFIKSKVVMTDQMVKEAEALEDEAEKSIAALLVEKGYEVRVLTPQNLGSTPALRDLVTSLNGRYDEEWSKILHKPRKVRQGRYNAGDDASKVASLLKVDGLLIARVVAVGVTGGKAALTALLSLGTDTAESYARMDLSVIQGKTGRVEGHFNGRRTCTLGNLIKKPAKLMTKLTEYVLDDYPEASYMQTGKEQPASAREDSEASEKDDAAAIRDFEALLQKKAPPEHP